MTAGPIWIYNIPDMKTAETAITKDSGKNYLPVVRITGSMSSEQLAVSSNKNFVLTSDIALSDWNPSGIGTFTGKFYGNGHTVNISGTMTAATDMGLFGVVSGGLVRDLTVNYNPAVSVTGPDIDNAHFGGMAGTVTGAAQFLNVLVSGDLTFTVKGDNTAYAGGIVGLLSSASTARTTVSNAYSSLNLTVDTEAARTTGSLYIGGVTGSMGAPGAGSTVTVEKAAVIGDIYVGKARAVNVIDFNYFVDGDATGLFVGGLTGFMLGRTEALAVLQDSQYRQGTITIKNGKGNTRLGGAIGKSYQYGTVERCSASAKKFDTVKTDTGTGSEPTILAGGFVGEFRSGTIKDSYSDNPVEVNIENDGNISVYAGGFAAMSSPDISYCYAKGKVTVNAFRTIRAGGFSGHHYFGNISSCFATGDVRIDSKENYAYTMVSAGGFAGVFCGVHSSTMKITSVSDCYALGHVFANKTGGSYDVCAGGFFGISDTRAISITRCFAAGSVVAQRGNSYAVNAGGFAGLLATTGSGFSTSDSKINNLQNCAAIGASVTAAGGSPRNIGRFYGGSESLGTISNNRVYNDMWLFNDTYANRDNPAFVAKPYASDDTGQHGMNASDSDFRRPDIWRNAVPSGTPSPFHGMGFSDAVWDFSTVGYYGHPVLRSSPNGPAMGGQ